MATWGCECVTTVLAKVKEWLIYRKMENQNGLPPPLPSKLGKMHLHMNDTNDIRSAQVTEVEHLRRSPINDVSIEPDLAYDEITSVPKSRQSVEMIRKAMKDQFLFTGMSNDEVSELIDVMRQEMFYASDEIIVQGNVGDKFYILENGDCSIHVNGQNVGRYQGGDSFGELALMYNCPRAATIRANSSCVLWSIQRTTFRRILATTAAASQVARVQFLRNVPLLQPLSNNHLQKVAAALRLEQFEKDEYVIRQGDAGATFYLIVQGKVQCTALDSATKEQKILMDLNTGDYFGEMALMLNEPRQANCIAMEKLKCFTLDRNQFNTLLGPLKDLLDRQMRIRVLRSVPLLKLLSDEDLDILAHSLRVVSFEKKHPIITQGEVGSTFYMISEGSVQVSKDGVPIMQLKAGDFFGERALLKKEPRAADCVAMSKVECLTLDRSSFERQLGKLEHIMEREIARQQAMQEVAQSAKITVPKSTIHLEDLVKLRTIGTGTFGRVMMVRNSTNDETMALKCMQKHTVVSSHQQRNVIHEKTIVAECDHPLILKLYNTFSNQNQLMMLLELVQGGELWSLLYEKNHLLPQGPHGSFDTQTARFYASNIVSIFHYLAKLGIGYRDLKPENLLIDSQGYLKMVDFGFAKHIPFYKGTVLCQKSFTLCGTPEYLSPELVLSKGHNKSVDYWALGCLIYELLIGNTPFQDAEQPRIFEKIVSGNLIFPDGFDPIAKDLITRLLHPNPALRLGNLAGGVMDIMQHRWFTDVNYSWDAIYSKSIRAPFIPPIKDKFDASNFDPYPEDEQIVPYNGPDYFEGF